MYKLAMYHGDVLGSPLGSILANIFIVGLENKINLLGKQN